MKTLIDLHEDLRKWFSKTDPAGDWKRINSKGEVVGPCAREPGEPKPKCMSRAKRESLTKKERAAAVRAKRKHDPNPERKGEPINVSNYGKGKISENMENLNEKNVPTNPELWSRAKALARSKFDVYPSAYANGWASKWYKGKGGSWKSVSEAVKDEYDEGEYDQEGDMAKSDLRSIMANAKRLHDMIEDADNLPEWCQNKITLAEDYISTVANYLTAEMNESDVYGKPTTDKTPTVTLKHKTSGKEIVVTKKSAPGYKNIGYHPIKEEEEFAGYIAHYNGQKHEIKSHEAKDLYGAKQKAIAHFKIPKSKHGLLSVKPGYNEDYESSYDEPRVRYERPIERDSRLYKKPNAAQKGYNKTSTHEYFTGTYNRNIKKQKPNFEEVEPIDEISRGLADRYVSKVTQQQVQKQGIQPNMYDKLPKNRQQGVSNALKRTLVKSPVKEETMEESKAHKVLNTFFKNREVAQRAFTGKNKPVEKPQEKKPIKESRKAEIVKNIMKRKKSDKFEAEPELSNTQTKSDQTT